MNSDSKTYKIIQENKTLFIILMVGFFLVELEIFAVALMKSGHKSRLQILDEEGVVLHETDGKHLSEFNKYYFEKTFGPLDRYRTKLVTREHPFPFRAWFTAAVGIPLGAFLLLAFIVKGFVGLFYGESSREPPAPFAEGKGRLENVIGRLGRSNIFVIGFLAFMAVLAFWVIPNFFQYMGRVGIDTLVRFKWFFLGIVGLCFVIFGWMIYLKYLLAKKTLERQAEVEKYRLQLEFKRDKDEPLRLKYTGMEDSEEGALKPMRLKLDQEKPETPQSDANCNLP